MHSIRRSDAEKLIDEIRADNGGLSPEDRDATRPSVLKALANVRRKLGAATKKLALDLYTKKTRFIYELIQNAEDNLYTVADFDGDDPRLSFTLYPDRIVIESNEDGFTEEDVRAICSTGESTKSDTQGYIGEKGIGFKSVFNVAKKVHIQSGPFSFFFTYMRDSDEDGLGMVTPYKGEYRELETNIRTRITLTLLDSSIFEQLVQDFYNLPDTLLLFLNQLKLLEINVHHKDGRFVEIRYANCTKGPHNVEQITKVTRTDAVSTEKVQNFHVIRRKLTGLPPDNARKFTNQATSVLAFPLDAKSVPVIEQQHVFAFFPVRRAGFTFLIQSDFITTTNREDVLHSPRNQALLDDIATGFCDAVLQFCENPKLQYQWMRYLPSGSISDGFWGSLGPKIVSLLSDTPCLRSEGGSLYMPNRLYRVPQRYSDQFGRPLFDDLPQEMYLSHRYTYDNYKLLRRSLKMSEIDFGSILKRVRADLVKSDSRYKNPVTSHDWHRRAAKVLLPAFEDDAYRQLSDEVKRMELIPIKGNGWESAHNLPVYFPDTDKIIIPTDLGLKLVKAGPIQIAFRKTLFTHLGVVSAKPESIIALICERYTSPENITLQQSIEHLRYLYWKLPESNPRLDERICLRDTETKWVYRTGGRRSHIYFQEEEDEYGPYQLFLASEDPDSLQIGHSVHFLHAVYLNAISSDVRHHGRAWKSWLADVAGVKAIPQLQHPTEPEISHEICYIYYWRPEKLLGLLKHNWSAYRFEISDKFANKISNWHLHPEDRDCRCSVRLGQTFLPLPQLMKIKHEMNIPHSLFIDQGDFPKGLTTENLHEWKFLQRFNCRIVDFNDDDSLLNFYCEALDAFCKRKCKNEIVPEISPSLFKLYAAIEKYCVATGDDEYVQSVFDDTALIYVPDEDAPWVKLEDCVWEAPEWLEGKISLRGLLDYSEREHLFREILEVPDACWKDYMDELETIKEDDVVDASKALDIYRSMSDEVEIDGPPIAEIRAKFDESELIFVPSQNKWCPSSVCIWADDEIQFDGDQKVPIKTPYTHLENFFCKVLGVFKPDVNMHVKALIKLANSRPVAASQLKHLIMLISSMNPTKEQLQKLYCCRIFPAKLANCKEVFVHNYSGAFIADRLEHVQAFSGKIDILDFSVEEVHFCKPFFSAMRMEHLYISNAITTMTRVEYSVKEPDLTLAFQSKAYAIFRDNIFEDVNIGRGKKVNKIKDREALFHLDHNDDDLRLYIPKDEALREQSLLWHLPGRLLRFLSIDDWEAKTIMQGILACKSLDAVDGILADAGIIQVDGIERMSETDDGDGTDSSDDSDLESIDTSSLDGRFTPSSTTCTVRSTTLEAE